jgi:hypothetical protein
MTIPRTKSSGSSLIHFGVGLCVVAMAAIAYLAVSGDESMGRLGTLAIVGLPVGFASLVAGVVTKSRERRR